MKVINRHPLGVMFIIGKVFSGAFHQKKHMYKHKE
ncbi:MAG: hypothetical protein ACJATA_001889 [Sphingobacteriales bacterium]|jgi:hypothetical protein